MTGPMLTVEGLDVAYGDFQVLWGAELRVDEGEIVCVLGPNGAGKSTLMNTISGLVPPRAGRITFLDRRVDGLPAHRAAGHGLAHVLERRRLFPFLTVLDNVLLGAHNPRARPQRAEMLERVEALFPVVRARRAWTTADLVLVVLDSSQPLDAHDFDLLSETDSMRRLVVANKHDLPPAWRDSDFAAVSVSSKTGE